jgi:hypothetical protein
MTLDIPALRQAVEAGDLQHEQIAELLDTVEQQATEIADLNRRLDLAIHWTRAHYNGKRKADQALLDSVRRVARDSAALARRWPKHELARALPGGQKPTKEQRNIANMTANGIATHIMNQVKEE